MTAVIDTPNPDGVDIKDIPSKFLVGDKVDWEAVQAALGVNTPAALADALLFMFITDWKVNYYANEFMLRKAVPAIASLYVIPPAPATLDEAPWLSADIYCEGCPGSEYIDYGGGFAAPRCGSIGRVDRYTECQQYRQGVNESTLTNEESEKIYAEALARYEENLNDIQTTETSSDSQRHVHSDVRDDRNRATEAVQRLVGGLPRVGLEDEAD